MLLAAVEKAQWRCVPAGACDSARGADLVPARSEAVEMPLARALYQAKDVFRFQKSSML